MFVSLQKDYYRWYLTAKETHKLYLKTKKNEGTESFYLFEETRQNYIRVSMELSNTFMKSIANFNTDMITIGMMLTTLVSIELLFVNENLTS